MNSMKLSIQYGTFFRSAFSIAKQSIIDECNRVIGKRSGIYCIRNKITNDRYIGQSKNIVERLSSHKTKLKYNKHLYRNGEQTILQKAWNKYGENNFEFKIVELCNEKQLNEREKYWINKFRCNRSITGIGYNLNNGGSGTHNGSKNISGTIIINNGVEQIHILPEDLKEYEDYGYVRGLLPENKDKINASRVVLRGEEHPHYGKQWSKEHREKVEKFYSERKNYVSPRIGKPLNKDAIKKIKETWKNKTPNENSLKALRDYIPLHEKSVIQSTLDGIDIEVYSSIKEASIKTGVHKGNIVSCCKGNRNKAGGFLWRYNNE